MGRHKDPPLGGSGGGGGTSWQLVRRPCQSSTPTARTRDAPTLEQDMRG